MQDFRTWVKPTSYKKKKKNIFEIPGDIAKMSQN